MAKFAQVREDFLGPFIQATDTYIASEHFWRFGGTSIITPTVVAGSSGTPGQIQLLAGNTIGFIQWLALGGTSTNTPFNVGDVQSFKFRLRHSDVSSCRILAGLGSNISTGSNFGSNGMFFRYDSTVGANWRSVSRSGGAETATDAGAASSSLDLTTFEFIRAAAGRWYSYITDSSGRRFGTTHTANVPSGVSLALGVQIETLAAASRGCVIDLIELDSVPLSLR